MLAIALSDCLDYTSPRERSLVRFRGKFGGGFLACLWLRTNEPARRLA